MSIAIGCDEAGFQFKEVIKNLLLEKGLDVEDFGVYNTDPVLYPDIAVAVAKSISEGKHERGILICGTGIGMAIAANKVPGIRAAVCHDSFSTERSRKSNNAQIMALGARVIGIELAKLLVDLWLECEFGGGGSEAKVNKIMEYENEFLKSCR
ncbi:ribose 5-phosphate isomerase B [Ruminiclostridium cellulolyticum]|uniref:Sugar-phosphate isomerase, RpiB/LacA/LacB family n=1 Tax=Ruminiclostridium cellulolyticum (strain ATCC 35319 / DSM 5812 / JCM 6584 / H10) TaxID=394503 RepID=B8I2J8_RUMCH|nr:ribose 5-phosphate isomerase B [Ruminiclostridium cellulolyticum]ACL75991.1 sugar-phosphate isomerase, RpiB/LacA/LacB family [Ruminiclostridium cellulolyticum H10]